MVFGRPRTSSFLPPGRRGGGVRPSRSREALSAPGGSEAGAPVSREYRTPRATPAAGQQVPRWVGRADAEPLSSLRPLSTARGRRTTPWPGSIAARGTSRSASPALQRHRAPMSTPFCGALAIAPEVVSLVYLRAAHRVLHSLWQKWGQQHGLCSRKAFGNIRGNKI